MTRGRPLTQLIMTFCLQKMTTMELHGKLMIGSAQPKGKIDNQTSTIKEIVSAVPQGSVLGP